MGYSLEKTRIRKIGNGRGVLLSKSLCNLMGMGIDDSFRIELDNGKLILIPMKERRRADD